jgi:hypothetical protein
MYTENVDIKKWAQQIRQAKILELQQLAAKAQGADAIKLYRKLDILLKK